MRALVIGSLPPPFTPRSRSLLGEVLRLRAAGAEVEVCSPSEHAVAHRHLELSGPAAAIEVALAARSADLVVVQVEPGFPIDGRAGRATRAIGLGALTSALRATKGEVVLRLHSTHDLAGGPGGRAAVALWQLATRIEVADEAMRDRLAGQLGPELAGRLTVAGPSFGADRVAAGGLGGDATLATVTDLVRARAALEREEICSLGDEDGPYSVLPRVPLWEWAPEPGAGVPEWADAAGGAVVPEPALKRAARSLLWAAEARPATRPIARTLRLARRAVASR